MIEFKIKRFNELSVTELYYLLKLRAEVFIVEQNCVYQDIDGKDEKAIHVLGYFEGNIVACTRLFAPSDYFEKASIGRVVVDQNFRDRKWGINLMEFSVKAVEDIYKTSSIQIHAQAYLIKFYGLFGFKSVGEEFLEDDIPHIRMDRD
jgi:ElaA protein